MAEWQAISPARMLSSRSSAACTVEVRGWMSSMRPEVPFRVWMPRNSRATMASSSGLASRSTKSRMAVSRISRASAMKSVSSGFMSRPSRWS